MLLDFSLRFNTNSNYRVPNEMGVVHGNHEVHDFVHSHKYYKYRKLILKPNGKILKVSRRHVCRGSKTKLKRKSYSLLYI